MERTLDTVKAAVSAKYIGRAGIHAIGIQRAQNALTVYMHPASGDGHAELLRQIQADALPFNVVTVTEEQPVLH